jgi:hypothetical protein
VDLIASVSDHCLWICLGIGEITEIQWECL